MVKGQRHYIWNPCL